MTSYQYVYVMKGLSKAWPGGKKVLDNVWLSFYPGAKIGVLGPNGAGKSTLLKIMAGLDTDWAGEAWVAEGATVGYLPQEPQLDPNLTVEQNVLSGLAETKALLDSFEDVSNKLGEVADPDEMQALIDKQAALQEKIDAANAWDLTRTIEIALDALRCPPSDSDVNKLSGGERRRVALCRLLLQKPDLLLLDEPTNHLDAESIAWLQQHLLEYPGAVVMVTHDRYFLDNVTGWILELDRSKGIPHEGNYTSWLEQKEKRLEQEAREETGRQRTIARELEWIRQSPKARQAKSKARVSAFEYLVSQSANVEIGTAQIIIPSPPRLGNTVIDGDHINKAYNDRLLIDDLSFKLPPGGIVGVIGPNGAGKTTLFRMVTGQEKPDGGAIKIGETVKLGYVDQSRDSLNADKTVWEEISDGLDVIDLGKKTMPSRAYVGAFGFKGPDQQKKVGILSGGERNRVHMAKMLKSGANVLLLDEPSNDLDVDTLRALEDALVSFPGCVVVITHDRWFMDRIATHILAFEGDSQVVWFEGNYQDYEVDRHRRLGSEADQPHRIKYKPLVRS
jgi:energy-dependent translational throttle protein EttA